ncbi:MAG: hypothetical protein RBU45_18580 [Myxococcota bacterium]|jgi:hypothetical protein|nr:hypothetical protein [Myxococcota bacterium]
MRKLRPGLPPLVIVLLVVLAACRPGTDRLEVRHAPPADLPRLRVAVVQAVDLRWPCCAEDAYRKTSDLIAALSGGRDGDLILPEEVTFEDPRAETIASSSNGLYVARSLGYPPEETALVRVWVEPRVQRGTQQLVDDQGRIRGAGALEEATYLVHGELWQYLPTRLLAAYQLTVRHDPFAPRPDWDERPVIREAVQELGQTIGGLLRRSDPPRPLPDLGLTFSENPVGVFDHTAPGLEPLTVALARLDPLEAEVRRLQAFQYFQPKITPELAARLARLPRGLLVLDPGPTLAGLGLRRDDLLVGLGEVPLFWGAQLRRELRAGRSRELRVRRGREELVLTLPTPGAPGPAGL